VCTQRHADPNPECPQVLTRANEAYRRVLVLEAANPNPEAMTWDGMSLATKRQAMHDAEALQSALHEMVDSFSI
jgi:hypothetical protein